MATSDLLRHQKINSLMAQPPEKVADAAIDLWGKMAIQIISIVGEGGFNSLYARSVFLTQASFPWLAPADLSSRQDQRFAQLKTSFAGQTPAQAGAANSLLLITFTDILATLIGEPLTTSILRSAWGNDASDSAGKEFTNE
ncbi:hypothetical protein SFMTTN_3421 [Sulfuriferula multivorans]|uniref:Uncharacterized protein n=1 Tax=Sulfuriferula multivorans TaxID=1559896 RepID=A0A401JYZ8_9PROT|nr:hypothetical protein [Sulfuriferula multivorans]GCB02312.1 hypothetical protein SFMTTN_3421 [Sulfuriferula multivorans]